MNDNTAVVYYIVDLVLSKRIAGPYPSLREARADAERWQGWHRDRSIRYVVLNDQNEVVVNGR